MRYQRLVLLIDRAAQHNSLNRPANYVGTKAGPGFRSARLASGEEFHNPLRQTLSLRGGFVTNERQQP